MMPTKLADGNQLNGAEGAITPVRSPSAFKVGSSKEVVAAPD